ncbi:flavodoxin [Parabacteroides hominis]|jgi:flavodoxin I|uniref:Flavodoxin n=1 Tax=Parabacteroides hominis TaxID=2763057 RepID=A0ABR7DL70_9BACT|nr:flavodoxin [Parabacteroides hominis]MBC5632143.1 flavodoxin [Parabacteroides hominis]MBD9168241.1 flavodoxin [Parabacteroides johnsonii]
MKKIGLFYGGATAKTAVVALKIQEAFAENEVVLIPIEGATRKEFESFDNIIAGTSTWFDGELPTYWDEFLPEIESIDMTGKKVALFGLGDQERYPDNFVDGIGILAEAFTKSNAELVGFMPVSDYQFTQSRAVKEGHFLGLALDVENQSEQTEERILKWVAELKKEFR